MKKIFLFSTLTILVFTCIFFTGCDNYYEASIGGEVERLRASKEITAVSRNGYRFVEWSDGETDPTRAYDPDREETVQAIFEPINVILCNGEARYEIELPMLTIQNVDDLLPNRSDEIYKLGYFSEEACERFSLDSQKDLLAQIKEQYLGEGISDTENIVLYASDVRYSAAQGGEVIEGKEEITAVTKHGYRFTEWSDGLTSRTRKVDPFVEGSSLFEAQFEPVLVDLYANDLHIAAIPISEFVTMDEEKLIAFKTASQFEKWSCLNVDDYPSLAENEKNDLLERIRSVYAEGKMAEAVNIQLTANFIDGIPESFYDFRTIAHAMGGNPDTKKTYENSLEAFEYYYAKGQKFFEIDLLLTSDSKVVAAHKYETKMTYAEFMATKREGFTPIDLTMFVDLIMEHPDTWFDIDILSIYRSGYEGTPEERLILFYDLLDAEIRARDDGSGKIYKDIYDRIVLEIFFEAPEQSLSWELSKNYGFQHYMYSGVGDKETPIGAEMEEWEVLFAWCRDNEIRMMSTKVHNEDFLALAKQYGIFTFAYTFNSPEDMHELFLKGIDCVFTDYLYF